MSDVISAIDLAVCAETRERERAKKHRAKRRVISLYVGRLAVQRVALGGQLVTVGHRQA